MGKTKSSRKHIEMRTSNGTVKKYTDTKKNMIDAERHARMYVRDHVQSHAYVYRVTESLLYKTQWKKKDAPMRRPIPRK